MRSSVTCLALTAFCGNSSTGVRGSPPQPTPVVTQLVTQPEGDTPRDRLKQSAPPSCCQFLSRPEHVMEQPLVRHVTSVEKGVGELEGHQEQGDRDNK